MFRVARRHSFIHSYSVGGRIDSVLIVLCSWVRSFVGGLFFVHGFVPSLEDCLAGSLGFDLYVWVDAM